MLIKPVHGFHILPVVVVCSPDGRQQQLFDAVSTLIENRKRDCTRFLLCGSTSLSLICCLTPSVLFASGVQPLNVECQLCLSCRSLHTTCEPQTHAHFLCHVCAVLNSRQMNSQPATTYNDSWKAWTLQLFRSLFTLWASSPPPSPSFPLCVQWVCVCVYLSVARICRTETESSLPDYNATTNRPTDLNVTLLFECTLLALSSHWYRFLRLPVSSTTC